MIEITNVRLYTGETYIDDGCVQVDQGCVVYAGSMAEAPTITGTVQRIHGRGGILIPGFADAHAHTAMTLFRGLGSDLSLMPWLGQIMPLEDKLDGTAVYWGTMMGILEMLRNGITAFADMYFHIGEVCQAALDTGIRASVCRGASSIEGVDSHRAVYEQYHGAGEGRIRVPVGVHAEYTSDEATMRHAAELAAELKVGMHIHASETEEEHRACIQRHGATPVGYLYRCGALSLPEPSILAHGVYTTEDDWALLAATGAYIAHCPSSNLKLGSGIAPISAMRAKGVSIALGTDGAASNNALDMIAEMRLMSLLQKGTLRDATALPAADALSIATHAGIQAMGYSNVGRIAPGYRADLVLLHADDVNLFPGHDPLADVVYAAQGMNVRMTMVDGAILYWEGEYPHLDKARICARAREAVEALLRGSR